MPETLPNPEVALPAIAPAPAPAAAISRKAHGGSFEAYQKLYTESLKDPDAERKLSNEALTP